MTKILLVEDNHQIAAYLDELLQAEGFDTQIAGSKKEAGNYLLAQAFDLVLLDVSLPVGLFQAWSFSGSEKRNCLKRKKQLQFG